MFCMYRVFFFYSSVYTSVLQGCIISWHVQQVQVETFTLYQSQLLHNISLSGSKNPTYGELIDLLEESEYESPNNENLLYAKFKARYPKVYMGRPRRFHKTVQ